MWKPCGNVLLLCYGLHGQIFSHVIELLAQAKIALGYVKTYFCCSHIILPKGSTPTTANMQALSYSYRPDCIRSSHLAAADRWCQENLTNRCQSLCIQQADCKRPKYSSELPVTESRTCEVRKTKSWNSSVSSLDFILDGKWGACVYKTKFNSRRKNWKCCFL